MRQRSLGMILPAIVLMIALQSSPSNRLSATEWTFGSSSADSRVQFDTASVVSCRDITSAEFAEDHPGDRLLEATIEISMLRRATRDFGVEYVVQMFSPDRHIQVTDYTPKTHVESGIAGNVAIENIDSGNASIGIDAGGLFDHLANINGHATVGGTSTNSQRFEQTPDHQVVLASGLMQRGAGVYFKVRTSPTTAAEGGRRFTFQFRVSENWRGERWHVYCQGYKQHGQPNQGSKTGELIGRGQFVVAAFLAGDRVAKQRADEYADTEFQMRRAAIQHREASNVSRSPSVLQRVGLSFERKKPRLPGHWPNLLIFGNPFQANQLVEDLPDNLRPYVEQWRDARDSLDALALAEDISAATRSD